MPTLVVGIIIIKIFRTTAIVTNNRKERSERRFGRTTAIVTNNRKNAANAVCYGVVRRLELW